MKLYLIGLSALLGTLFFGGAAMAQCVGGGDLAAGPQPGGCTVIAIQGKSVSPQAPLNTQVLGWSSAANAWVPVAAGGTGGVTWPTTNDIVISNSTSTPGGLAPVNGDCVVGAGGVWTAASCASGGSGTVTSVALTLPNIFSVAGSPVTTAGTLAGTLATEAANAIFAGPATGAASAPTFRALAAADLPLATNAAIGGMRGDGTSISCTAGVCSTSAGGGNVSTSGSITTGALPLWNAATTQTGVLTPVSDDVVIGISSAWSKTAIPSCVDTGGNHLNYTLGGTFSCGTSSSGGGSVSITSLTPNLVVAPSPITGTGTIGSTNPINAPADGGSHSYSVNATTDVTKQVSLVSTFTAAVVPRATSAGMGAGICFSLYNAGAITATTTTSTINGIAGATGLKLGANGGSQWCSDGADHWTVAVSLPTPATQSNTTVVATDGSIITPAGVGDVVAAGNNAFTGNNTHTGLETFAAVHGGARVVTAGSTDTLLAADCGKSVIYNNAAYTVTIPAAIVPASGTMCVINVRTNTANKATVTGTAVSAATLVSADSYTGTQALAGSAITLSLTTVGSTTTAFLDGHGS